MWYIMLHSREHAQHLCTRSQPSQLTLLPSPCSTAFPAAGFKLERRRGCLMSKFKVRDASPSLWAAPVPRMCTRARPLSVPAPHAHVQSLCPLELLQPWQTAAE